VCAAERNACGDISYNGTPIPTLWAKIEALGVNFRPHKANDVSNQTPQNELQGWAVLGKCLKRVVVQICRRECIDMQFVWSQVHGMQ
jgi:hypothetical protein